MPRFTHAFLKASSSVSSSVSTSVRTSAKRFTLASTLALTLFSGAVSAGPRNGGQTGLDGRLDQFVTRGDTTYVQRPDGSLTPLMDKSFLESDRDLDAMEEATGEELKVNSAVPQATAPTSVDLSAYQTPIKDQADRGTCWVFAIIAAVEARYKRDYGTTLDLSEQYFNHLAKSTGIDYPKVYKYENQSSYWGGGNSSLVSAAMTYATPLETYAPYKNQSQMDAIRTSIPEAGTLVGNSDPALNTVTQEQVDAFEYSTKYIPASAAQNAKYAVTSYQLYNSSVARNTASLENLLAAKTEVIIDVDLKWKYNSTTGIYEYDSTSAGGGHCFVLIGYNRTQQYFLVKNSWGGTAYLKVAYNFFQNAAYSASVVYGVRSPSSANDAKARTIGFWAQDHDGWKGKLVVRRSTGSTNASTRLGSYYDVYGKPHTVNGYYNDGNHGMVYYIANETENAPGTLTGQQFQVDQYSWAPDFAAGATWAGSVEYGTMLSRTALNAPYSSSFTKSEWVGTWNLNFDGWTGKLTISAVSSSNVLTASYVHTDGKTYTVTGNLDSSANHIARFKINFSTPQAFTLHYHTWDDKLASGSTSNSGIRYGVHATK